MTVMHDNRHIVELIYMHMFKFIYRSYRYTYLQAIDLHLTPLFIAIENWPGSLFDEGCAGGWCIKRATKIGFRVITQMKSCNEEKIFVSNTTATRALHIMCALPSTAIFDFEPSTFIAEK